jgi:hypothetical protein
MVDGKSQIHHIGSSIELHWLSELSFLFYFNLDNLIFNVYPSQFSTSLACLVFYQLVIQKSRKLLLLQSPILKFPPSPSSMHQKYLIIRYEKCELKIVSKAGHKNKT